MIDEVKAREELITLLDEMLAAAAAVGKATAGNNRKVHIIRQTLELHYVSMCGVLIPKRPQTTQEQLPKCKRCF